MTLVVLQLGQQTGALFAQDGAPPPADGAPGVVNYDHQLFLPMMAGEGTAAEAESKLGVLAITSYTIDVNLTDVPNVSGAQLDAAVRAIRSDSPLIGLGNGAVSIGRELGINPVYIMAHAAWESAWGTSQIARLKNNLFGYGAFDNCPFECAHTYSSMDESVRVVMNNVKANYLTAGGIYYTSHGSTLRGMNVHYATDSNWGNGINSIMNMLATRIGDSAYPGGSGVITPPAGGCYANAQQVNRVINSYTYQYLGRFIASNRCSDVNIKTNYSAYVYLMYYSSSSNQWVNKGWQYVPANSWFSPATNVPDGSQIQMWLWNPSTSSRYYASLIAY